MVLPRALLLAALMLGCAPAARQCPVCPTREALAPQDRVAIEWVPASERGFPTLRPRIAGARVALVLDSGANYHFIEHGAAWWLGLDQQRGEAVGTFERPNGVESPVYQGIWVHDGRGEPVFVERFAPVEIDLGLAQLTGVHTSLLGMRLPGMMDIGFAGVLSPQELAPEHGAIDLDLRGSGMRVLSPSETERALRRPGWATLRPVCPSADGAALFSVSADVHGAEVELLVDTGSDRSELSDRTSTARRLRTRGSVWRATLGTEMELPVAEGVRVEVAGGGAEIALVVGPRDGLARCGVEGILGNDVLRNCRLVIGRARGAIRCGL